MVKYSLNSLFGSLSDETRRDILWRLLLGEQTISQLSKTYKMSLPAVSKHLKVLETSGLIVREKRGRQWFVRLSPMALQEATEYLQQYKATLHNRLDSFSTYLQHKPLATQMHPEIPSPVSKTQALIITEVLDADPDTAWQAYIDPTSIAKWWRLPGATLLHVENDVRVGGTWRFTVRGADDHDYILGGTYSVVERPHRLEYTDHVGDLGTPRPEAHVVITFKQLPGNKTLLTKKSLASPAIHQLNAAWYQAIGQTIGDGR